MALVLDESFLTAIPGSFATLRQQSGTLSATYNAGAQAVDLSNATAASSIWDITSQPLRVAGEMEVDIEFVADLSGASNYRHCGVWPVSGDATAVSNGYRIYHYQPGGPSGLPVWAVNKYTGATAWAGIDPFVDSWNHGLLGLFDTAGHRRTINVRWDFTPSTSNNRPTLEVRIDGTLVLFRSDAGSFASLRPGLFIYMCTMRLHSIKVWDAPQVAIPETTARNGLAPLTGRLEATPTQGTTTGFTGLGEGLKPLLAPLSSVTPQGSLPAASATMLLPYENRMVPPGQVTGAAKTKGILDLRGSKDYYRDGDGKVYGTLKAQAATNVPIARKLWLFEERSGQIIRETWSDPTTGYYEFLNVDRNKRYTIIGYDYAGNYRAVVADNVVPELIPYF